MKHNLEDIARIAGVSRSTVSRVVNNDPHVREATRRKVLHVIAEQGYRPNRAARALATRRTRTLSLVIPQQVTLIFPDPYFPLLIQGIIDEASRHDYAVMLWMGSHSEQQESFYRRVLANGLFDGVLVTSVPDDDHLIPRLITAGFPLLVMGRTRHIGSHNAYIDVDNRGGAHAATVHLLNLGHRRVGTITGPLDEAVGRERLIGYRQAHADCDLPVDEALIVEGQFDEMSGHDGMKTLLERRVDAVFVASDMMAIGALRAIKECGLGVPDDIALVGFDDHQMATTTLPPLTTVHQPIMQLGATGARKLIEIVENRITEEECQIVLPTRLIIRESCGASRKIG